MRSKKFILLVIVLLLVLSQIPFIYRRYKLRKLSTAIQQLNSGRTAPEPHNGFVDYKGVVHVHSSLGGHSDGTFSEIISAAQANQLQFVIMTEHTEKEFDTAGLTLKDTHGGVLFINGNEVSLADGDRLLVVPGDASLSQVDKVPAKDVVASARARGAVALVAYPEEFKSWDSVGFDGVEVYNVFTNAKRVNPVLAFFDVLWSQRSYPDLIFALYFARPDQNLQRWDQALARSRLTATAGNDAHANIGLSLKDSSGKTLLGIQLDPYETSFRLVRLHVLIEQNTSFDAAGLMDSLHAGHCFLGFDFLGDSSGFSFEAENPGERKIQGDEISLTKETRLRVRTPVASRVVFFKDGMVWLEDSGITTKEVAITERGVYRVEVYLPQLGNLVAAKPWIISNPIYVR